MSQPAHTLQVALTADPKQDLELSLQKDQARNVTWPCEILLSPCRETACRGQHGSGSMQVPLVDTGTQCSQLSEPSRVRNQDFNMLASNLNQNKKHCRPFLCGLNKPSESQMEAINLCPDWVALLLARWPPARGMSRMKMLPSLNHSSVIPSYSVARQWGSRCIYTILLKLEDMRQRKTAPKCRTLRHMTSEFF